MYTPPIRGIFTGAVARSALSTSVDRMLVPCEIQGFFYHARYKGSNPLRVIEVCFGPTEVCWSYELLTADLLVYDARFHARYKGKVYIV
eukprot:1394957-Amorphochlora_amoeboformis.AAC.1